MGLWGRYLATQLKTQLDDIFDLSALSSFKLLDVQNVVFGYQDAKHSRAGL